MLNKFQINLMRKVLIERNHPSADLFKPRRIKRIFNILNYGGTLQRALNKAEVNHKTLDFWCVMFPKFKEQIYKATNSEYEACLIVEIAKELNLNG